ncbi:MAG: hypothetical protein HZA91_15550 [Verrucomicrobia bacterium]|nr:hypothetical protein [Verrucomicrobiota bacterium]
MSKMTGMTDRIPQTTVRRSLLTSANQRKLAYALMLLGTIVLAVTGLGTFVLRKPSMSGWVLMLHASAAPLFAVGLALVALTWAGHSRLGAAGSPRERATNLVFWLMLASGAVVILSGLVPMTPLFGTSGQHVVVSVHFYSAMLVTASVALHLLSLAASR